MIPQSFTPAPANPVCNADAYECLRRMHLGCSTWTCPSLSPPPPADADPRMLRVLQLRIQGASAALEPLFPHPLLFCTAVLTIVASIHQLCKPSLRLCMWVMC